MTTSDASLHAWLDQEDRHTARMIRQYGVYIQSVGGDEQSLSPPFAYTVGLFGIGHPELLALGLDLHTAAHLLNDVAARIRDGHDLTPGEVLTFDNWSHRVTVESVPNPGQIAFAANAFFRRPDEHSVDLLQLTCDDVDGRFPWEDGYARPAWVQPRPGEFRA